MIRCEGNLFPRKTPRSDSIHPDLHLFVCFLKLSLHSVSLLNVSSHYFEFRCTFHQESIRSSWKNKLRSNGVRQSIVFTVRFSALLIEQNSRFLLYYSQIASTRVSMIYKSKSNLSDQSIAIALL